MDLKPEQELDEKAEKRKVAIEELRSLGVTVATQLQKAVQAAEAAEVNRQEMDAILANHNIPFVRLDVRGNVLTWNRAAEEVFGWLQAQVIGKLLTETLIPARYARAHNSGLAIYAATGKGPIIGKDIEMPARCADGRELQVRLTVYAMEANGKEFIAFVNPLEDEKVRLGREQ